LRSGKKPIERNRWSETNGGKQLSRGRSGSLAPDAGFVPARPLHQRGPVDRLLADARILVRRSRAADFRNTRTEPCPPMAESAARIGKEASPDRWVASQRRCKWPGPSRARRRFPQVLTRRRRRTYAVGRTALAVGGDRGADRPVAGRGGRREPSRDVVGLARLGAAADHPAGCGRRVRRLVG
jgi:hypothetical protein